MQYEHYSKCYSTVQYSMCSSRRKSTYKGIPSKAAPSKGIPSKAAPLKAIHSEVAIQCSTVQYSTYSTVYSMIEMAVPCKVIYSTVALNIAYTTVLHLQASSRSKALHAAYSRVQVQHSAVQ